MLFTHFISRRQKSSGLGKLDRVRWKSYLKLKNENEFAANGSQYLESKRAKLKRFRKQAEWREKKDNTMNADTILRSNDFNEL